MYLDTCNTFDRYYSCTCSFSVVCCIPIWQKQRHQRKERSFKTKLNITGMKIEVYTYYNQPNFMIITVNSFYLMYQPNLPLCHQILTGFGSGVLTQLRKGSGHGLLPDTTLPTPIGPRDFQMITMATKTAWNSSRRRDFFGMTKNAITE